MEMSGPIIEFMVGWCRKINGSREIGQSVAAAF